MGRQADVPAKFRANMSSLNTDVDIEQSLFSTCYVYLVQHERDL